MLLGQRDDRRKPALLLLCMVLRDVGQAVPEERVQQPLTQCGEVALGSAALAERGEQRDDLVGPQGLEFAAQRGVVHRLCHREVGREARTVPAFGQERVAGVQQKELQTLVVAQFVGQHDGRMRARHHQSRLALHRPQRVRLGDGAHRRDRF